MNVDDAAGPARRIAWLRDALAGGRRSRGMDIAAAQQIEAEFPGTRRLPEVAWEFHRRAALWAVAGPKDAPAAAAVIFTAAGLPPPGVPLHAAASAAVPPALFCYTDSDPTATLLSRVFLALLDPERVSAANADEEDPSDVLAAAAEAGLPVVSEPVSVHVILAPQRWPGWLAQDVLAGYCRLLAPGSTVCLSVVTLPPGAAGDAFAEAVRPYTGRVYRHDPAGIASWFGAGASGLDLHPEGVADARVFARPWARARREGARPAARVMTAVGIVPW